MKCICRLIVLSIMMLAAANLWGGAYKLETRDIDDFTISLPENCVYSEKLSRPDEASFCYSTPDKSLMFIYCYFVYDGSFTSKERLIGEAAEMGIELTDNGDIATLILDDTTFLDFCVNDHIGIGVSFFYPNDKVGLFVFVMTQQDDFDTIISIISSLRIR